MNIMKHFIQSAILLVVLTAISVFSSPYPYLCILLAGLLLIIFGIRSVSETQDIGLLIVLAMLSFVFAYCSGNYMGFLIFYEFRVEKADYIRVSLPEMMYGVVQAVMREQMLSEVIFRIIILAIVSAFIYLVEILIVRYLAAMEQAAGAVSATAVSEMYEKKLNQELVVKNYLADRNARLEERENISRNIHNSVGHSITAAIMTLDAADMLFDSEPDRAREKMNTANERIRTSLNSIRHAVRVLDKENEYVEMTDFMGELISVFDNFMMDTQIRIRMDFSKMKDSLTIPHEHAEFLTGAVQELLANGVRHGSADLFTVIGITDSAHIQISVQDNGKSDFSMENQFVRIKNGFGLKKIDSYVRKCGGTVTFSNEHGFKTVIVLPLFNENGDNRDE